MDDFKALSAETKTAVERVIAAAERSQASATKQHLDGEVYAYPHPGGGIAWGVNGGKSGFNIARGIRR